MPNLLFRIELFRRAGFTIWSSAWYGGHTTPGYSVLLAPLGAIAGPGLVGAASAVIAAVCFDLLLRTVPDLVRSRAGAASLLFAAGTVVNLAIGRLAFALGLALGLAALAARRRHRGLALVLSVATPFGSPVAGVFLLLAWLAVAIHARHRRAAMARALVLAAATLAPARRARRRVPGGRALPVPDGRVGADRRGLRRRVLAPAVAGAGAHRGRSLRRGGHAHLRPRQPARGERDPSRDVRPRPAPRGHGDPVAPRAGPARRPAAVVAVVAGGGCGRAERERSVDGEGVLPAAARRAGPARPARSVASRSHSPCATSRRPTWRPSCPSPAAGSGSWTSPSTASSTATGR